MENEVKQLFRTMPRRPEGKFSPPALGGSSLLVVFAVLSLTVFALLSLSTVRADQRLGEASAKAVADYYAADLKAQEILADLREGKQVENVDESMISGYWDDKEVKHSFYEYGVPISDTQELRIFVEVTSDGSYSIFLWQAMPVGEWTPDDGLHVFTGE